MRAEDANLYRRQGSPYWWLKYQIRHHVTRVSTECRGLDEAREFRDRRVASLASIDARSAWAALVDGDFVSRNGWHAITLRRIRSRRKKSPGLTKGELREVLLKSGGHCALTGRPVLIEWGSAGPNQASVDRIDRSLGYSIENCRIVGLHVNVAMNRWSFEELLDLSRSLVSRYERGTALTGENRVSN